MRQFFLLLGLVISIPSAAQTAAAVSKPLRDDRPAVYGRPIATTGLLTLEDAWKIAEASNPSIRAALANVGAAEGQLKDTQGLLWNNPQATTDVTRRRAPQSNGAPERFNEWSVGVAQTFEIGGQHAYRRQAAELDLTAARLGIDGVRAQVRAQVELAFYRVLAFQQRIELERDALKVITDAAEVVRKRVDAGEDTRLEGNLAAVEAERGRNQLAALEEQLLQARADLAVLLQMPPGTFPEVAGQLMPPAPSYTLSDLLGNVQRRPQLRVLETREEAAKSRLALERAAAYPDVTVGITTGREGTVDMRERLAMLTVSVPIPVFKRNASGISRAATELAQTQIERATTSRDVEAQVRTLWQKLESARARVTRLTTAVLPALDENRRLSTTAYRAGEIGLVQLLLVNRQLLEARRDYLEAFTDFILDRIALEQAAGFTGVATMPEGRKP